MPNELAPYQPREQLPERVEVLPPPRQEYSIQELIQISQMAVKSGIYRSSAPNPEAAFMLALRCQAEGIHPGLAFAQFHLIEGQPSLKAEAMLARFQRAGGVIRWLKTDASECVADFSHPVYMPEPVKIRMSMADMDARGVSGGRNGRKDNWRKFPDAMLRARTISAGVRACLPGVVSGVYTPEELEDLAEQSARVPRPAASAPTASLPTATMPALEAPSFKAFCAEVAARGELDSIAICRAILRRAASIGEAEDTPEEATPKDVARAAKAVWDRDPARAADWVLTVEAILSASMEGEPDDDIPGFEDPAPVADPVDPEDAELDRQAARDAGWPPSSKSDRLASELG